MNDVISRLDAINAFKKHRSIFCDNTPKSFMALSYDEKCRVDEIDSAIALLVNQPSAQQWIPCSERLPSDEDYDETFTVTIQCEHHDGWDDYVTGYAEWTPHGWDIQSYYIGQIKVVAWMPLPEPYKEVK